MVAIDLSFKYFLMEVKQKNEANEAMKFLQEKSDQIKNASDFAHRFSKELLKMKYS